MVRRQEVRSRPRTVGVAATPEDGSRLFFRGPMEAEQEMTWGMRVCSQLPTRRWAQGPRANTATSSPPCVSSFMFTMDGNSYLGLSGTSTNILLKFDLPLLARDVWTGIYQSSQQPPWAYCKSPDIYDLGQDSKRKGNKILFMAFRGVTNSEPPGLLGHQPNVISHANRNL